MEWYYYLLAAMSLIVLWLRKEFKDAIALEDSQEDIDMSVMERKIYFEEEKKRLLRQYAEEAVKNLN